MDNGFWIDHCDIEDDRISRLIDFSRYGTRVHSTVTVGNYSFADGSTIGPHSVIGEIVELSNCTIGAYCTVAEGSTIENLVTPDHCYIEAGGYEYGTNNGMVLVWSPKGLLVKPGCYPLEPVAKTFKRLSKPKKISEWDWHTDKEKEEMANDIIDFLHEMNRYKVV